MRNINCDLFPGTHNITFDHKTKLIYIVVRF